MPINIKHTIIVNEYLKYLTEYHTYCLNCKDNYFIKLCYLIKPCCFK